MRHKTTTNRVLTTANFRASFALAACLFIGACGSAEADVSAGEAVEVDPVTTTTQVEVTEAQSDEVEVVDATEPEDTDASDEPADDEMAEDSAVDAPDDGRPAPPEGGERRGPRNDDEGANGDDTLATGPTNVGEHGPFSNADANRDVSVTRAELDQFMEGALEREIGLVAFFDIYDENDDDIIDNEELALVDPAFAFDGTDANEDGLVSLAEVEAYANEEGRSYRAIGLGEFFDLVDTDDDDVVSPEEIEVAHESGLLARF